MDPRDGSPRTRATSVALHLAAACGLGLLVWLLFGRTAFVNYDSAWSLDWMRELVAGGSRPDLGRVFSPTPHPLSDLFSAILVPFSDGGGPAVGRGAETALVVSALFWLGALGVVTFRIATAWFGVWAGVVATVLVLTREPVLSYGLRTYLDLPYAVFLLLALLAETRRPRGGARTVAWITLAGLLRPEAWLLAAAYVAYLAIWQIRAAGAAEETTDGPAGTVAGGDEPARTIATGARPTTPATTPATADGSPRRERSGNRSRSGDSQSGPGGRLQVWAGRLEIRPLLPLIALALIAPLGWIVEGLVLAGDPLQALTGTQQNAADLDRVTGVGSAITVMPRRLGEIVREPVLLAAFGGVLLSLAFLRRRAVLGVAAAIAAGVAFFVLAAAGLPLLTRYLVFPATLLIVFAAAGLLGWRHLPAGHAWVRRWQAFAVVSLLAFVVFLPSQVHRLDRLQSALALQQRVIGDLRTVTGDVVRPALQTAACGRGGAPYAAVIGGVPADQAERVATWLNADVALPNHRAVPQVLLWLGRDDVGGGAAPPAVSGLQPALLRGATPDPGISLLPSSAKVARGFILDKADGAAGLPTPPPGSVRAGTLGTWSVYTSRADCAEELATRLAR
ncbi:hypothetical protein AB0L40_18850 [Patulibacter sp. NPDC049589]|uniref:hypothetical protein n=1 Tax=Patulibacter sp. NPDC049589 TaxID=3154731 RepID=UPI00341C5F02